MLNNYLNISINGGRSSVGRAPGCDPGCRGFKSHRSPHFISLGLIFQVSAGVIMTANILNGKALAHKIQLGLKDEIERLYHQEQRRPGLAVIMIGNDPASTVYVNNKRKACQFVGIHAQDYDLPETTTQEELLLLIDKLNGQKDINGILVQLPLPRHINPDAILDKISPKKDVDGFHPYNIGRLLQRRPLLRPCTPLGVIKLLEHYQISIKGSNAVIVGASNIVGRPMGLEMLLAAATVTTCHRFTQNLQSRIQQAEILISATGNPDVINPDWIQPGTVVIDIGMTRGVDGKLRGDIDFDTVKEKAAWITPVPGGVGPMTVSMLLSNTLYACKFLTHQ